MPVTATSANGRFRSHHSIILGSMSQPATRVRGRSTHWRRTRPQPQPQSRMRRAPRRRSVLAQELPDEVGVLAAAREEIRRIGMSRPHLGAQACRRQRQPVGGIRLGAEPGPRRQRELVRADDGACEVQLVGHVER
jgi:hypothetical protein